MSDKQFFPVSKEQFEQTVQRWIDYYLRGNTEVDCGFCDARYEALVAGKPYGCENCALHASKHCGLEDGNTFEKWFMSDTHKDRRPFELEMLEGLYDYGVAHGYIDPAVDNLASSGIVELCVAVEPICGAGVKAEW